MGLLNNNYRENFGSVRFFGSTLINGASPYLATPATSLPGAARNIFATDAAIDPLSSKPTGARAPVSWQMAQKPGGLSSRNATFIDVDSTGLAVGGKPISGSSDITFTVTGTGGLIVSGSGSASITLSPTGTLISVAAGSGSATVTLSGTALIGALAGISGQTSITLSPTAAIRAVGYLAGLASNETEFSPDALARAVWDATATEFNIAGTMGEKLNSAGTAGDPWTADLSGYAAGTAGNQLNSKVLTLAKYVGLK